MIDILEIFKPELLDIVPVPHYPYVWQFTVSIVKPPDAVADWWKTTFGGGTEYNEERKLVGSFWDSFYEYNEKTSLADCRLEEKSFYFDSASDPQTLDVHVDHNLLPIDTNTIFYGGYGEGYSNADGVYIDGIFYNPWIKSSIPYKIGVDPINTGLAKTLSGNVTFDNAKGQFDNGDSWYGSKVKGYKYSEDDGKIPSFYGNIGNESFSFEEYTVQVKDSRDFDDVKIILDKWDTTWLETGHSKIGKSIPIGFGECLGVEAVNVINPTSEYKKFKGVSECLTVDDAYVQDEEVWTSVTVYNSSTDGTFELANADCLDADSKLLKVKVDYTCDYENLGDRIIYLNEEYKGISYDTTNYNTELWEYEDGVFSSCGGIIDKDISLLKYIGELQAAQQWPFFYWRDQQGRRSIKIDNPNRTPKYTIAAEDIMNFDRPNERDNENFATSIEILYSYDYSDKTYLSYVNDTYRNTVFRIYRKYQDKKGDEGLKTQITNEADAENLSYIKMEDWQAPHDTFSIAVRRSKFPDIEILDILNIDLAIPEDLRHPGTGRTYFGEQRVKVIEMSYDENDFIQMQVRTQPFSAVISGIGGYMSTTVVNNIRISDDYELPLTENNAFLVYNAAGTTKTVTYDGATKDLAATETGLFLYDGTTFHLLAVWDDTGANVVNGTYSDFTTGAAGGTGTDTVIEQVGKWIYDQGYISSGLPVTGTIVQYAGATAPTDWLLCEGETIGDASSGADYAGADYEDLFNVLNAARWGNPGGATWASHDTVLLPDFRNVTVYGANSSTRSVGGRTQDAMSLGATHADQHEQIIGQVDMWGQGYSNEGLINSASGAFTKNNTIDTGIAKTGTSSAGSSKHLLDFDSSNSSGANAGTTTKAAGLAATFIIKI